MTSNTQILSLEDVNFSQEEIMNETERLYSKLSSVGFDKEICEHLAPIVLEINYWKQKHDVTIVAHSYQTPDIIFGVADHVGDSYQLSKVCQEISTKKILFSGVKFMAETAKIMNPEKIILLPSSEAGCSLADSITGEDVRGLKAQHPGIPVVTYINTTAEVKAESDIIVTSGNAMKILNTIDSEELIFIPDKYMTENMANRFPNKKLYGHDGVCIVHEEFSGEKLDFYREQFGEDVHILVHTECAPEVVSRADMAGGTGDMIRYIQEHSEAKKFFLVTECGLTERLKIEYPDREFVGSCNLCPYMKKITLNNILECIREPKPENIIELSKELIERSKISLNKMVELTEKK
ncbi:MAG: quinolinate synthase NadA [Candidatus Hodarchaeales archaeon]|jgi:quinolinate synthase